MLVGSAERDSLSRLPSRTHFSRIPCINRCWPVKKLLITDNHDNLKALSKPLSTVCSSYFVIPGSLLFRALYVVMLPAESFMFSLVTKSPCSPCFSPFFHFLSIVLPNHPCHISDFTIFHIISRSFHLHFTIFPIGVSACVVGGGFDHFPFCNVSLPLDARVHDLVSRIPSEAKANLLTARGHLKNRGRQALPELGVPSQLGSGRRWGKTGGKTMFFFFDFLEQLELGAMKVQMQNLGGPRRSLAKTRRLAK